MKSRRSLLIITIATALILSACSLSQLKATNDNEWLYSAVPATLTAIARQPTVTSTPTQTSVPTSTPVPPGLQVVYSKDRSIWVWREGGQPKRLTFGSMDERPRISADGKLVVFKRANELYVVNADGTNFHKLVSDEFLKGYIPRGSTTLRPELYDWMVDTHDLYFTTAANSVDWTWEYLLALDLFRVDVDSGEVRQIMPKKQGGIPYFSPDGKTIALVQPNVIYLIDPDGSNLRKGISFDPVSTFNAGIYLPKLVPLPDSSGFRVILFISNVLPTNSADTGLWNIPLKGDPTLIFSFGQNGYFFTLLSPDGKAVEYSVFSGASENEFNGCVQKQGEVGEFCLNHEGALIAGQWSPDSTKLTYVSSEKQGGMGFYIWDSKTGKQAPIVTPFYEMNWVDNDRYLYIDEGYDLYLASLDGNQVKIDMKISEIQQHTTDQMSEDRRWSLPFDFSD